MDYDKNISEFIITVSSIHKRRNYQMKVNYFLINLKSDKDAPDKVRVYQDKVSENIWNKLNSSAGECIGKKFLLSCEKYNIYYHLKDWKEIK